MSALPIAFAVALLSTLLLTPAVRAFAWRVEWISRPRGDRFGQRSVALAGGIAIVAGVSLGCLAVGGRLDREMLALLAAGGFMFLVGLLDDRLHLRPHTKFLAQILAAVGLVEVGFRFGLALEGFVYFDQLLAILWLVGITNAFNLLDNMDGLCAGIAAFAALALAVLHAVAGEFATAAMAAAVAGAALGFLRYNFAPASIFMGDGGSLFLGLMLAGFPLLRRLPGESGGVLSTLALPVVVLMVPLLDVTLVTIARRAAGRPVSQGGCDHASHRLVALGLTPRRAVLALYALGALGGLIAVAAAQLDADLANVLVPLFLLVVGGLGLHLGQVRIYESREAPAAPRAPLLRTRGLRRLAELAIDALALTLGFQLAGLLRFEAPAGEHARALILQATPFVVLAHLAAYLLGGVYRGLWRHTSISDVPRFGLSVVLGGVFSAVALGLANRLRDLGPAVLVLNAVIQFGLLTGSRVSLRLLRDLLPNGASGARRRALIVGGGDAAELLLRRLRLDPSLHLEPVGVVGCDPDAVGLAIHGTPVVGTAEGIRDVLTAQPVGEVILVDDGFPAEQWARIRRVCGELGVAARTLRTHLQRDDEPAQSAN